MNEYNGYSITSNLANCERGNAVKSTGIVKEKSIRKSTYKVAKRIRENYYRDGTSNGQRPSDRELIAMLLSLYSVSIKVQTNFQNRLELSTMIQLGIVEMLKCIEIKSRSYSRSLL